MNDYPLTIFHDGDCPICRFDVANLQARNDAGRLRFIDIASPGFDATPYGLSVEDLRAAIHAQRPDGSWITGMAVFRLACRAVGLGWLVAPTGWPLVRGAVDVLYRLFARRRPWIARRLGFVFEAISAWQANRRSRQCHRGQCKVQIPKPAAEAASSGSA